MTQAHQVNRYLMVTIWGSSSLRVIKNQSNRSTSSYRYGKSFNKRLLMLLSCQQSPLIASSCPILSISKKPQIECPRYRMPTSVDSSQNRKYLTSKHSNMRSKILATLCRQRQSSPSYQRKTWSSLTLLQTFTCSRMCLTISRRSLVSQTSQQLART